MKNLLLQNGNILIGKIMSVVYFLDGNRQKIGPLQPQELIPRGVKPETLVWMPGLTAWTPARQVPELAALFEPSELTEETASDEVQEKILSGEERLADSEAGIQETPSPQYDTCCEQTGSVNVYGAIGLVVSILMLVVWIPFVGTFLMWLVALVFSILGLNRQPKGLAIAGLVICIVLFVMFLALLFVSASFLNTFWNSVYSY